MGTVLLGMSLNFFHSVRVAHDLEVEAPSTGNAGLPEVLAFVILLGPQRRVSEIFQEQQRLFVKGALNFFRSLVVVPSEVREKSSLICLRVWLSWYAAWQFSCATR